MPQAAVVVRAFNRRVNCLNVRKLQHPHALPANKFTCFCSVLSGGSESRSHINGLCAGVGRVGQDFEENFCPLLLPLHLSIGNSILPRDYEERGWIRAHKTTLIITYLFSLLFSIFQSPTLNPSNNRCQDGNYWF